MISPRHPKTVDRVLRAIQSEVRPGEYVSANELRRRIFDKVQVSKSELSAIIRVYGQNLLLTYSRRDEPHLVSNFYQGRDGNGGMGRETMIGVDAR